MNFAELVKNREWEKIFDLLDKGTIEFSVKLPRALRTSADRETTDEYGRTDKRSIAKDKLGVLTKEEFEEALKQNGFEESAMDAERQSFIRYGSQDRNVPRVLDHMGTVKMKTGSSYDENLQ